MSELRSVIVTARMILNDRAIVRSTLFSPDATLSMVQKWAQEEAAHRNGQLNGVLHVSSTAEGVRAA